jgi:pimeloyl-ACP methyl ester carboxylesterase
VTDRPLSALRLAPLRRIACLLLAAGCLPGCASLRLREEALRIPPAAIPRTAYDIVEPSDGPAPGGARTVALAELAYAEAMRLDAEDSPAAVEAYLQAALAAWPAVEAMAHILISGVPSGETAIAAELPDSREAELYESAVVGLLVSAQKYGRWNPVTGLVAMTPHGMAPVETTFHGFVWSPSEFGQIVPVGHEASTALKRDYRRTGLGVPLVVVRNDAGAQRPFIEPSRQFAATALVRPVLTPAGPTARLEFYDPLRRSQVQLSSGPAPLASDISAPLARAGVNFVQDWLEPFLRPAAGGADDALTMVEPYQPGKIPVILIHGLLSDPLTWNDMINELQAQPQIISRYQIWTFRYDSGEAFFTSAAVLRRQLAQLLALYDPTGCDPAATNIVAVGHSMGGLVANLQVTYSGNTLWSAAARVPLEQVLTDPATRANLRDAFFFEPSPHIARVVYIGTPHLGSGWARRAVGSLGSALVEPAPLAMARHEQVTRDNPGVFSDEMADRFPTSVDLLEPSSPLLNATARLPYRPGVITHSIIGEGQYTATGQPTDGVVPVASARLFGAASERMVIARHAQEPRNDEVLEEVMRILNEHALGVDVAALTE